MTGSRSPSALIYVQHLLGIGHLARIARVAAGLVEADISVTIACGGPAEALDLPTGAELLPLPPVKVASHDMGTLLHPDGRPFEAADKAARRDLLLAELERLRPDILIIEAFPFGRRAMRFELLPLLEAARQLSVPVVASSIRDILQESRKAGRAEETAAMVERFFDIVLVHGEETVTPLALTFPLAGRIAGRLRYTGLVGPPPIGEPVRDHAVIVSAGGGAVGAGLLHAAIAARPLTAFAAAPWLVLAGPNLPSEDFVALERAAASKGIDLRRHVGDLPARLAGAALSVSQAGYNTVAEIEAAGCPAVLVPFAAGGETEQSLRAAALERVGRAIMVAEAALTPERLAAAIDAAPALPTAAPRRFDGASRSAAILLAALAESRHAVSYQTRRAMA
jgi:predicted glycosyltransferase